jgi:hypothetical protein
MTPAVLLVVLLAAHPQDRTAPAAQCATWQACRDLALEAAASQDYERFHDLAWRAVQRGPRNDPALMILLARAQSLSGRPGDALVMLQRLATMGIATDAATSDDFQRVRNLPAWPEFERTLAGTKPPDASAGAPAAPSGAAAPAASAKAPTADAAASSTDAGEALRFTTLRFVPAGLAYDAVSDRFIVGNGADRKLTVVDEASQRVANLAGAQSAGFGEIAALEIDPHEGDLWVVSRASAADGSRDGGAASTLHKLQLISGRVLYAIESPKEGSARFVDVAVSPRSTVFVLDEGGRRVLRVAPKSKVLEVAARLDAPRLASVAPESDTVLYIAHAGGLLRVDTAARQVTAVSTRGDVDVSRLTRIRWHRGALVGIQQRGDGACRVVRLRLDAAGRTVAGREVLDDDLRMSDPTAAAFSGDVLFYLVDAQAGASPMDVQTIVRRVTVH